MDFSERDPDGRWRRRAADPAGLGRSLQRRATVARAAFVLTMIAALLVVIGNSVEMDLLREVRRGAHVPANALGVADTRQLVFALLHLTACLLAAGAFAGWLALATRDLRALLAPRRIIADLGPATRCRERPEVSDRLLFAWLVAAQCGALAYALARVVAVLLGDGPARGALALDTTDTVLSVAGIAGAGLAIAVTTKLARRLHERAGLPGAA